MVKPDLRLSLPPIQLFPETCRGFKFEVQL